MKKWGSFFLIFLILILFPASVLSHPGRTDSNGGHRDSSTGEYHYHHGYPAHQHDNGVCPYDYDDKTNHDSSSGSSSSSTTKVSSNNKDSSASAKKSSSLDLNTILVIVSWGAVILYMCYLYIRDYISSKSKKDDADDKKE